MARGPRFFSPAVQSAPWSYESTSNDVQMMTMQDIRLTFIPGSYPICRAACSTKPQRIVSNPRALFLQTLSAGRIWDITKGCSTLRPCRMKTSTSSSRASLVGHMEPLRKESAYDHLRSLKLSIVEHSGIMSEKRKGQDDMTKPATHAALANSKGLSGKSKKSTQQPKGAISMPRNYVARENSSESDSSGNESPVQHALFARVQLGPMPKLSVQSIFGPKSRPALDTSKTRWDTDRFGHRNPRPKVHDMDATYRADAIRNSATHWDDRFFMASPKDSLTSRTQGITLSDEDQHDELLQGPRPELLRHAESLLSSTKSVELYCEPVIVEEDCAEQVPAATSSGDDHGSEPEINHPQHDARNVQPETVCNVPPQTRSRTRRATFRYPSPVFPGDDEVGGLLDDSYGVPMRPGEDLGNSSIQASGTSRDKPNPRMVINTARTATPRAPKDGTPAPPEGKASGGRSAPCKHGPPTAAAHAAAKLAVWPPLSAPGATIFDQHDDASHNATTRPDLPEGDHPGDM